MENKDLISNEYYSLSELFATRNRKIIIPDFQRDYCWGDKTHGEKKDTDIVNGFIDTLLEEFTNISNSDVLLGKIDVYESPKNHIYLTDGQQRLTTLYLLIGMLYRKAEEKELKNNLKNCLISEFEESHDDKEPYLQYAVRESTLFFTRDIVNEFFIRTNTLIVTQIKDQSWYFSEYNLDPSIISMLSALEIIEKKLNESKETNHSFAKFIVEKVKIQYYDVQDKKHGEERFVIINTTGKSLTVSENIKPILLGNIEKSEFAEQWEKRETFFWKNRNKDKENIADNGVNDFLTWCFQIEDKQEKIDIIKDAKNLLKGKSIEPFLKKMQINFDSLKTIIEYLDKDRFQSQFKFINDDKKVNGILGLRSLSKQSAQNVLLPLLAFISKPEMNIEDAYQFLRRLRKNYFDLKWEDRKTKYVDWRYVLQIIEKSKNSNEIFTFDSLNENQIKVIQNVTLNQWYNEEEKIKNNQVIDKNKIVEWEDHPDFMGDLSPLFSVALNNYDIEVLTQYFETYKKIQLKDFSYSNDTKLKNIYLLNHYISNGKFEHRGVGGWGYCMLVRSEARLFLSKDFNQIWAKFNTGENLYQYFKERIQCFFQSNIIKDRTIDQLINDTREIGHYKRVQLWSLLEFLFATKKKLDFTNSICQFWEYPNLILIESNDDQTKNNYEIGNLLLGTSYFNNKTGWIEFNHYPLMNTLNENRKGFKREEIELRTKKIKEKLEEFLNS